MRKKFKGDDVDWATVRNPKHILLIILGTALAVLAMKGFMIPNRFMDGGVTGISILLHAVIRKRMQKNCYWALKMLLANR